MEIPENINNIIQKILESEDKWKALYMATWGFSYNIEGRFKNTNLWEKKIQFGLPAARKKYHEYEPERLHKILTSKDGEFTLGHLQTLFSLLEELVTELCFFLYSGKEVNAGKFGNLKNFLLGNKSYETLKIGVIEDELKELKLAKETRNCFIHNSSKVDKNWLVAYKEARGENRTIKTGDELSIGFHQIEDWHELIVQITNRIKGAVIKI